MDNREEFLNLTQYDFEINKFKKSYLGCNTCGSIEQINYTPRKLGFFEYIREYLISLRLLRL